VVSWCRMTHPSLVASGRWGKLCLFMSGMRTDQGVAV
jgi:hypothetical protein